MIETIMIFALGFLGASLLALMIFPAVNRRAERLAKRRLEALFPLSISELTADRDHLRAEFAVAARRLERRIETLTADKAATLEEAGRRAFTIKSLQDHIAEQKSAIETLKAENGQLKAALAETRDLLATTEATLARTRDTLAGREEAFAALDADYRTALADIDARRIAVVQLKTQVANLEADLAETERMLAARVADLDEERALVAQQQRIIERETARGAALAERLSATEAVRDDQAQRIEILQLSETELAKKLTETTVALVKRDGGLAERDVALATLQARIAGLEATLAEAEAQARHEARDLSATAEVLRAEKQSLDGALQQARADRARLQRELANMKRDTERASDVIRAENAALRSRIEDVAAEIMRLAAADAEGAPRASSPA